MIQHKDTGFTIVELLIVIVVIAILAAIVIVSYNGINQQARQSSLVSDVSTAGKIMVNRHTTDGSYPLDSTTAHGGKALPSSEGVTYSFHSTGTTFCITARSSHSGVDSYYVSNIRISPVKGECPQDAGAAVTDAAGNGTLGAAPGTGTAATLAGPAGIAAGSGGLLYFTDQQGSRVRQMTTSLVVTNIAGNGTPSSTEGIGTAATFNWPQALTVGPGGVLYVADTNSHRIRRVPTNGTTTSLLAGSVQGNAGSIGATGTSIQFNTPRGIVYNPVSDTIYVADSQNNQIKQLDTTGKLLAVYGNPVGAWADGSGSAIRFNYPQGLAVGSDGTVYIADTRNNRIRSLNLSGVVSTIAGSTAGNVDGTGATAQFQGPMAIAVASDGTLYVADTDNHSVRKVSPGGVVTTIAGDGSAGYKNGTGSEAQFNEPKGIALGSDGKIYIADRANHRIRTITLP